MGNSMRAAEKLGMKKFAIAGGVASNSALREAMEEDCEKQWNEILPSVTDLLYR